MWSSTWKVSRTIIAQNSHLVSYFDTVSRVFWLVEMLCTDPFSFVNSRCREPIRCPGGPMPNIPLTFNHLHLRQCINSDLFVFSFIDLHPPCPLIHPLYILRQLNCHAFTFYIRLVRTIYFSPVRLAQDAYITTGLALVDRDSKRLSKFSPFSITFSMLS
jgi:hypothetical protein